MTLNRAAAAYLAYFAYIDDALETVQPSDFETYLQQVPSGAANGPWTLAWGPGVNDGILAYIAQGADGSYGLAFRGTDSDSSVTGAFQNFLDDLEAFNYVPWLYPQGRNPALQLSAGTNQAVALAIGLTDPATDTSLLDYLRSLAASKPLELIVAGHSLGGALTVAAVAWLYDQLPKAGAVRFSIWPHTFAAPTVWNAGFASWFSSTFSYYAAINTNDIVPMAWNKLNGILATFPKPGPSLKDEDWLIYAAVDLAIGAVPPYPAISPNDIFTVTPAPSETWLQEAGRMHSMEYQYFPHATGAAAPKLPNTSKIGVARPRAAAAR